MSAFSTAFRILGISAFLVALIACANGPAPSVLDPNPAPLSAPATATTLLPARTAESDAASTETSVPTDTPAPTHTPQPTPTPQNPLMIQVERAREYPGSQVKIEQTLAPGSNYNRYIASYLSDGLKIYALLTVPRGPKPETGFPVIIFNHGYIQPNLYRTTERYVDYVDRIARSGYIVFRSDYRGHGNSEGVARGGYGSPDYTTDVLNAVGTMKKFQDADPNRIGMWGHSMGGYITLRALVIDPEIKAGSIWGGVVASYPDMMTLWRRPASGSAPSAPPPDSSMRRGWRTDLVAEYGTPQENPDFWASISANSFLAEVSAPIQLHHGMADTSVPPIFSDLLYEQILAVDGNVELYKYPGDNHNISQNFALAMQRTIEFFDKYVKGS